MYKGLAIEKMLMITLYIGPWNSNCSFFSLVPCSQRFKSSEQAADKHVLVRTIVSLTLLQAEDIILQL